MDRDSIVSYQHCFERRIALLRRLRIAAAHIEVSIQDTIILDRLI